MSDTLLRAAGFVLIVLAAIVAGHADYGHAVPLGLLAVLFCTIGMAALLRGAKW